jgi:hypothetical protein
VIRPCASGSRRELASRGGRAADAGGAANPNEPMGVQVRDHTTRRGPHPQLKVDETPIIGR